MVLERNARAPSCSDWSVQTSWLWRRLKFLVWMILRFILQERLAAVRCYNDSKAGSRPALGVNSPSLCVVTKCLLRNPTGHSVTSTNLRSCRGGPPSATQVWEQKQLLTTNSRHDRPTSSIDQRVLLLIIVLVLWLCIYSDLWETMTLVAAAGRLKLAYAATEITSVLKCPKQMSASCGRPKSCRQ